MTDMNFAENFRLKRAQLGLSQQQMADKLGVTKFQISRWENGMVPTLPTCVNLAVDYLLQNTAVAAHD